MKRYISVGELIEDEKGDLITYQTMLKLLKMAITGRDKQVQDIQSSHVSHIVELKGRLEVAKTRNNRLVQLYIISLGIIFVLALL